MPSIPTARNDVGATPLPGGGLRAPDFGQGIGPGLQAIGGSLGQAAETQRQSDDEMSRLRITDLSLQYAQQAGKIRSNYLNLQGKNALDGRADAETSLRSLRDSLYGQVGAKNGYEARLFGQSVDRRFNDDLLDIGNHAANQTNAYRDTLYKTSIGQAHDDAVNAFGNTERFPAMLQTADDDIDAQARSAGLGEEWATAQKKGFKSDVIKSVVLAQYGQSALEAKRTLDLYRDEIDPDTAAALAAHIRSGVDDAEGLAAAQAVRGTGIAGGNTTVKDLFPIIRTLESRNQAGLKPSPAGALGTMQLLPSTAAELCKELNIPLDLHKLNNDADYCDRLGALYLSKLHAQFGGNAALTAAAYNAGPGNVSKWLAKFGDPRTGAISDADFVARIPFQETRNYVTNAMNALGRGGSSDPVPRVSDLNAQRERIIGDPNLSDGAKERALSHLDRFASWDKQALDERRQAASADMEVRLSRGQLSQREIDEARDTGLLSPSDWSQMTRANDKQLAAQRAVADISARFGQGPLNGNDPLTAKTVDTLFQQRRDAFMAQPHNAEDSLRFYGDFVQQAGFVPKSLASGITTQLRSGDPAMQIGAARSLDAIAARNPAFLKDFAAADIARGVALNEYVSRGLKYQDAVQAVDADERVKPDERAARVSQYNALTGDKTRYAAAKVVSDAFGGDADGLTDATAGGAQLAAEFDALRRQEYVRSGSLATANATALKLLGQRYALSYVNGTKQIMKFAPEAFYPHFGDPKADGAWQHEQAVHDLLAGGAAAPDAADRLMIMPHPTKPPVNGRPIYVGVLRQPDGTLQTISDARGRPKEWVPDWVTSPAAKRAATSEQLIITSARRQRGELGHRPTLSGSAESWAGGGL